jgi:RNA polymerase sigma factor (sigma-70 family)
MKRQPGCESSDNFAKLLAEARAGSEEAKGKLLLPYGELVRQWASQRLGRPFRIESDSDVSQEVFLSAWKNFDQFHGGKREELDGWMRAIFDNQFTSSTRFWHRDKRDISREVHWEPARFEARPPESATNLLGELIKREEEKILGQAIEELSAEEVHIILWRYCYRLPYEVIGTRINRTPGASRMFCHRAKEKLLERMRYPPRTRPDVR